MNFYRFKTIFILLYKMYNNIKIDTALIVYPVFLQTCSYLLYEKYGGKKNKIAYNSFFYWCGNA